jgi:hypothetical protein
VYPFAIEPTIYKTMTIPGYNIGELKKIVDDMIDARKYRATSLSESSDGVGGNTSRDGIHSVALL